MAPFIRFILSFRPPPLSLFLSTMCHAALQQSTIALSAVRPGGDWDARQLLDGMQDRPFLDWNRAISRHNRNSESRLALGVFIDMLARGVKPSNVTVGSVMPACIDLGDVELGKQVYALAVKTGFAADAYVCSGMIGLFAKTGWLDEALAVLEEGGASNDVCWNTLIRSAVQDGDNCLAVEMFCSMAHSGCLPNGFTVTCVLPACAAAADLAFGKAVHAVVFRRDLGDDVFVGTAVVDLYAKCGDMSQAMVVFRSMPTHNVASWTALISGFVQNGEHTDALILFRDMVQSTVFANQHTMTSILQACGKASMAYEAAQIHGMISKSTLQFDPSVKGALATTFASFGDLRGAEKVLGEAEVADYPDIWSSMVSGISSQSLFESVELLRRMLRHGLRLDRRCCCALVSNVDSLELGRQLHCSAVKNRLATDDVQLASALTAMYSRCGDIDDGFKIFLRMEERDAVSWTLMITSFTKLGHLAVAFELFRVMVLEGLTPDEVVLHKLLNACDAPSLLPKGKEVHGYTVRALRQAAPMSSFLVRMYSGCRNMPAARRVFDHTLCRDQLIWSYMISGYVEADVGDKALSLLRQMFAGGVPVDSFTSSAAIRACTDLARPVSGEQLHGHSTKAGTAADLSVSSALVTMYSRCGTLSDSRKVFDEMKAPDLVMRSAMIDGYAQHGRGQDALEIFQSMIDDGVRPDSVAMVSVLSACSRGGLIDEGLNLYRSMRAIYRVEPEVEHTACVIDMLCRSGQLRQALRLIEDAPAEAAGSLVWSSFLGACRIHGDTELARYAEGKILEMGSDAGSYAAMSNIAACRGDWDDVVRIRRMMMKVRKKPGRSSI